MLQIGPVKLTRNSTARLILALCVVVGAVMVAMNATAGQPAEQSLSLGPPSPPAARLPAHRLADPAPAAGLALAQLMGSSGASPAPSAPSSSDTGAAATPLPGLSSPASTDSGATAGPATGAGSSPAPTPPVPSLPQILPSAPAPAPPAPPPQPMAGKANAHLKVGVGDGSSSTFADKWFRRLPIRIARTMVPWNAAVTRDHTQLNYARAWIAAAQAAHVEPMISFSAPGGKAGNYIPSDRVYTKAVKAFVHDFPQVKVYTAWNEPDFNYRNLSHEPGLAAAYFNSLVLACHGCTIVAGDVYLPTSSGLASWVRAYKRGLHFKPKAWAIHPYNDVRAHTTSQLRTFERFVGKAQVWLDEISGVERRGHWPYPNQSPNGANNDERFMFTLPKRFHNITRIYHYQWRANPKAGWDSGLLGPQGKPRPAYWTFANATRGKLP